MSVHLDNKRAFRSFTQAMAHPDETAFAGAVGAIFADDANINICHPFNTVGGANGYVSGFLRPVSRAWH